jgi:hypothetical protein
MRQRGIILISCYAYQPLEVGNELRADKILVGAWHLLHENLLWLAVATRNHIGHVGQHAKDQIIQCHKEPVENGESAFKPKHEGFSIIGLANS